jgi:hypothetical protein
MAERGMFTKVFLPLNSRASQRPERFFQAGRAVLSGAPRVAWRAWPEVSMSLSRPVFFLGKALSSSNW